MNKYALLSLLVLGTLLVSCGGDGTGKDTSDENQTVTGSETAAVTEDPYGYPELDCGGEALRILNPTNAWGNFYALDYETTTGESLDDAIYNRNRSVEERYNTVLQINEEHDIEQATSHYTSTVMAGDDIYDVAYLRADTLPSPITNRMMYDLTEIDGFRFDEPWWDDDVVDGGRIGEQKVLYFASNYFSLYGFDVTVCAYFNEDKFTDLDLEFPYQLVRDGKWTLDRMFEYVKAGQNLNGDTDYTWNAGGNSVYGISTWSNGYPALLYGADAYYLNMDDNGQPDIAVDDAHFIDVVEKLTDNIFSVPGAVINTTATNTDGVEPFAAGRSMIAIAQVKSANTYRDMEDSFGLLPLPKYDESQEDYACYISSTQLLMCLPITSTNTERTALLMDVLAYESYRDVLPVYYEEKLSQKGLRNEDSIEMLDIVRGSRYTNYGEIFGWTNGLQSKIYSRLLSGSSDVSSDIAATIKSIEAAIEKTMDLVNE